MVLEWDEMKRQTNIQRHNVDFADLEPFFRSNLVAREDTRQNYGEVRIVSFGLLYGRALMVVYTINDETVRVISARPANPREEQEYYEDIGITTLGTVP